MARASKMSVQKRQRERQKAEKAALKREQRARREPASSGSSEQLPTREDLEAYGIVPPQEDEEA